MSTCQMIPQIRPIEITTYNRKKTGDIVYCVEQSKTEVERNLGNVMKQGSGGNSYKHYLLRKRGGIQSC